MIFPPHVVDGKDGVRNVAKLKETKPKRNITLDARSQRKGKEESRNITLERITSPQQRLKSPITRNQLMRIFTPDEEKQM